LLWKRDARNLKDYHIRQSSNVKLSSIDIVCKADVEDKDDSDRVDSTDDDSVISDGDESDE
jgi:hypothetical protein